MSRCAWRYVGIASAVLVGCSSEAGSATRMEFARERARPIAAGNPSEPTGASAPAVNAGRAPEHNAAGTGAPSPAPATTTMDGCGTSVTAEPVDQPRVDIIWVVDASGSMLDEQQRIGRNIAQFADDITSADIDVRIVMLTTSAAIPVICPVTDPDPAAATPLAGDPRYTFFNSDVDSDNSLSIAVARFPMYSDVLRPDAATHFIVVSDAESMYPGGGPAGRAMQFESDMRGLLGHDFLLHTISSEGPIACRDPNCMPDLNTGICAFVMLGCGAAMPGLTYWELANLTGGLTASICQQDWSSIFEPLTEAVVASAPLPCNYPIPDPPRGQIFVRDKVNVEYVAPGSASEVFPAVRDSGACSDSVAWYFDDPSEHPSEVLLCPAACSAVAAGGTLNVSFGCDTVLVQ